MTPAKSHRGRGWGNKHSISVTRSVLVFCCTSVLVGVKFLPLQEGSLALVGTCLLGKWEDAIGGAGGGQFVPSLKVNVLSLSMRLARSWEIIAPLCLRIERFGFFPITE